MVLKLSFGDPNPIPDKLPEVTRQVTRQVAQDITEPIRRVVLVIEGEMKSAEIQTILQLRDRESFRDLYLIPSIEAGYLEMTIPEKPNSPIQMYRLTKEGLKEIKKLKRK